MVITRTPYRISYVGGGSDIPAFTEQGHTGFTVNAAITRYLYVTVSEKFEGRIRACYSTTEEVEGVEDLQHELLRETMYEVGRVQSLEVHSIGDVPSGTGLGSSGAFTVGVAHALALSHSEPSFISQHELARIACRVEIERCLRSTGKQDQYISALGGLRETTYYPDGSVQSRPLALSTLRKDELQTSTMLLYLGFGSRSAAEILSRQATNVLRKPSHVARTQALADFAHDFADNLRSGNLTACGEILRVSWSYKKKLSDNISNEHIDDLIARAIQAGAWGAKVCGAGSGGFLLVMAPRERHPDIARSVGLEVMPFAFDYSGTTCIYNSGR